jgi:hypothetical protein
MPWLWQVRMPAWLAPKNSIEKIHCQRLPIIFVFSATNTLPQGRYLFCFNVGFVSQIAWNFTQLPYAHRMS